jgi:hypothetical protein
MAFTWCNGGVSPEESMESARVSSMRHLQTLYTVVVGIALTVALEDITKTDGGQVPLIKSMDPVLLLIALIVTMLPFYHGALRHLDATYIERDARHLRSFALLADFVILFVEGCLFLLIARQLGNPHWFAIGFAALLAVDIVWSIVAHFEFTHPVADKAEWKWAQNNTAALLVLGCYLTAGKLMTGSWVGHWLAGGVLAISLARTIVDYARSWRFYYPSSIDVPHD